MKFVIAVSRFLLWVSVASVLVAEGRAATPIDAEKSVTVRVFKAGVFSAFGHEHEISAPIRQGLFTENPASVKLIVDTRKMRAMDKDVSEKDRAEIQQTMLGPKSLTARNSQKSVFCQRALSGLEKGSGLCWAT
jgi:hypothetical protein